jgi:hypothetical protein
VTSRDDAWAGLAEDVGKALLLFAERLRAVPEPTAGSRAASGATRARPADEGIGASQLKVLEAVRASGADGVTSHEVAKATGLANSNTPRILKALAERGLVTASDTRPVVWKSSDHA